jgi:hypothetical protein
MTQVINPNLIIDGTPHVIAATPAARSYFNGAVISRNEQIPIDTQTALVFTPSLVAGTTDDYSKNVGSYFGFNSDEAAYAKIYFKGFDKSTIKPAYLYFVRQADVAVSAWLRGGSLGNMTLTELQALSSTLTLTIDTETATTGNIDLSAATSFSDAADIIDTALNTAFTAAVACTYDSLLKSFVITSGNTGGTSIVSFAVSDGISEGLKLTSANGAIRSFGYDAEDITAPLDRLIDVALNWTCFTTIQDTTDEERLMLAQWADGKKDYRYICWDNNADLVAGGEITFAVLLNGIKDANGIYTTEPTYTLKYTTIVYDSATIAMALMGFCAAINTDPLRGGKWVNLAFLTQTGLLPSVYSTADAEQLISKGVSFYGNFATAQSNHACFYNGKESGVFLWLQDSLADKKIRADIAEAFFNFAQTRQNLPFNPETYQAMTAFMDANVFQNALAIGMINANVDIDDGQKLQINDHFGNQNAAQNVFDRGFFFKVVPATSVERAERKATALYAYTTGGSIHTLKVDSYLVQ